MGIRSALTRRRLLGAAGAVSLVPASGHPVPHAALASASAPREEHVFDLLLAFTGPDGAEWQPITGGRFIGRRSGGQVLTGGTLRITARQDGVRALEASCSLQFDDGEIVALTTHALLGVAGPATTRPVHAVPEFVAPSGAHDWLNRAVLVASLDSARLREGRLALRIHRLA